MSAIIMYENGNAIGGEGHPTNASDITFDNTGTDLVSTNPESAIKEVNTKKQERGTVLWSNPSPTASFSAQNISLSSSDYDVLDWYYYAANSSLSMCQSSLKGEGTLLQAISGAFIRSRAVLRTDDTHFAVSIAYIHNADTSAETSDATVCVPIKIIGRKL